jgi:hypothetical protein
LSRESAYPFKQSVVNNPLASAFRRAGFIEVARAANGRPVMRYYVR